MTHATIFSLFVRVIDHFIPSRSLLLQKWDFFLGGGGGGGGSSIKLLYLMVYQLYPRYLVCIYLLAIHISGMTYCHGQLYCLKR